MYLYISHCAAQTFSAVVVYLGLSDEGFNEGSYGNCYHEDFSAPD